MDAARDTTNRMAAGEFTTPTSHSIILKITVLHNTFYKKSKLLVSAETNNLENLYTYCARLILVTTGFCCHVTRFGPTCVFLRLLGETITHIKNKICN